LRRFKAGSLQFLFTVDLLSEGVGIPEINLVLFLRPTESLTVFLQQLGRGLQHTVRAGCSRAGVEASRSCLEKSESAGERNDTNLGAEAVPSGQNLIARQVASIF